MEDNAPYNEVSYIATIKILFDFYGLEAEAIEEIKFNVIDSSKTSLSQLEELAKWKFKDDYIDMFLHESNIDIIILDIKKK